MDQGIGAWIVFNALVLGLLALDLGVFHRKAHSVSTKEAAIWSAAWIGLALLFNLGIYFWKGPRPAVEYLAGYLIEKSLSVDNIFVFIVILGTFNVPSAYQHRVLFWGVLGALVMRGAMIAAGSALLDQFHWIVYLFGSFLVFTGLRLGIQRNEEPHPERNPLLKLARRLLPVSERYEGQRFFVREAGRLLVTPLFLVLLVVEATDLVFAVDSIPAIFAVTRDPFIVYTSNVFALLGLRSLYFLLARAVGKFYYLKMALAAILMFVGVKMVVAEFYKMPVAVSLGVVVGILTLAVAASIFRAKRLTPRELSTAERR
ncbi:TerC family protein [candidate division WOR-3 bacterium]|uniref:TerC family protein n=1 Tax=candidate division WOR-3 bacterium TaxID=2052148 RepID=A0A938BRA4_UNCW3|nr:TerC family protein [candidate division WOR-3 bacterium]